MSHESPPPAPPACLMQPYFRKPQQKGGTLIAEDVYDLAEHERRLADIDGYRPDCCCHCGHTNLQAHDFRLRSPRDQPCLFIRRYLCVCCRAGWQILPAFLARHLQRAWKVIESIAMETLTPPSAPPVPRTTIRRYRFRLSCCAAALIAAFSALGAGIEWLVTTPLIRAAFCRALEEAGLLPPESRLASLAAWIHRLVPGLRLM
jgi:hypothetical protein